MTLAQVVKSEAHRLGFTLAGVTTPDPPPHFQAYLRWIESGYHARMDYLAAGSALLRRSDPRQILPECRSILVLGITYPGFSSQQEPVPSGRGRIAAYAWGRDYHLELAGRLAEVASFIETQVGDTIPYRCYTDTGPLLERDLAQRAGLGWIGKNTCLIHPHLGSHFFLAEILLGIELDPDLPFSADHCGTCRRCIDACPTGCILPDRTLDAQRCISYLTIENKQAIPAELRSSLGDWVFGCDVCQLVCPWNQNTPSAESLVETLPDPAFAPRPQWMTVDLLSELSITPAAFNRKFKDNPVLRPHRRGYLRNVAVALGSQVRQGYSLTPQEITLLSEILESEPEPLVRAHVAWALGCIPAPAARQALESTLKVEKDETVILEIQAAFAAQAAAGLVYNAKHTSPGA